jgi:catechol 2,3-dioxygenase-like lactoylglutathione lyase family enzyme
MTNGQIARIRGVTLDAVKFHLANVRTKLGLSTRQELRHWTGVPADSALHRRRSAAMNGSLKGEPDMTAEQQLGPIGQISRQVSDITAAVAWYRDVLGLPHLYTYGKLSFFDCGGVRLFLGEPEGGGPPGPESVIYFRVGDIHAKHAELLAKGVEFVDAPHLIFRHPDGTEEWMAFFKDTEQQLLALMSQVKP